MQALQYASKVPKPRLPHSNLSNDSSKENRSPSLSVRPPLITDTDNDKVEAAAADDNVDWNLLRSLRERHEKEKALVAEIASTQN